MCAEITYFTPVTPPPALAAVAPGPGSLNAFRLSLGAGSNSATWNPTLDVAVPAAAVSGTYAGT